MVIGCLERAGALRVAQGLLIAGVLDSTPARTRVKAKALTR